ncbi:MULTISPECIES: ABC transporter permease [unclassified Paenibacillus]|uniref:ABC transporter permease n=1 Tax=unclassified Paenibacillus TaxID=185978 RepID=UPI002405F34A|nr:MULTISPECIES: ABC transporter permease [unclassified Paenibacillus]MDF9842695.1 ABC-2 type transport system permease protein [Paenibacillus sp. PastF-2]MDF9849437.1 ABC-2 type transport system permease protein [Paenibacillus sp. PastM-2]MDF9855855.1 ABC-2 type transport system permease protein [Paenibacillus sp. PastF-1]MDH6481279.1 ABC-2 type transport system permease protein [Paenibacillus sp. PastH-2]MDH6508698.1 ABC-2 type transport system permease protein [Paenibacillus sp. PastM-3]
MDLKELRRQRRSRFMGSMIPYAGYVIRSGVAMVLLLVLIAFSAWYTALLRDTPADLPIRWIMLVLLLPAAVHSSFRTYLRSPDTIFLLPQGHRMKEYFAPAWVSGNVWKILRLAFILITLWPLYIRTDAAHGSLLLTALVLIAVKLLSSYGLWREIAMLSRPAAAGYQLLRWAVGGLMIAAWLWQPPLRALIFIVILAAAYFAALRVPNRHAVPWERLIATEKNQGTRALMMLGWFVDVPGREQRVYARRYLARWGGGIPWRRDSAFRFLLTKSFARGDVFGIVLRIAVLGMLLVLWNRSSYAGTGIYLFFLFITGIQLSSLRKLHSESFWLTVYPLPAGSRADSTTQFIFRTLLMLVLILGWPFLLTLGERPLPAAGSLLCGALLAFFFKMYMQRKAADPDDDDL